MAYRYRSTRQIRKLSKKSRRNFIVTLFLVALLLYGAVIWILPILINSVSVVKNFTHPTKKVITESSQNSSLAPPVLNIPYEATNTAQINIKGYATPNSKVALYLDDEKKDTIDVSSDGSFEFKEVSLSLGTNNIFGKSIDEKELESLPSKTFKILFDDEKPPLKIKEPEDNKKIQGGDRKIKITGNTEPGTQVYINDSQVIVDKDGNFSSEFSLSDGDNNFKIKVLDNAKNSAETSRTVTYTP